MIEDRQRTVSGLGNSFPGKSGLERGGKKGQFGIEPKVAGAFFLGPPLPLMGQLYVLAEIKEEVRLEVLDGASGKLRWGAMARRFRRLLYKTLSGG